MLAPVALEFARRDDVGLADEARPQTAGLDLVAMCGGRQPELVGGLAEGQHGLVLGGRQILCCVVGDPRRLELGVRGPQATSRLDPVAERNARDQARQADRRLPGMGRRGPTPAPTALKLLRGETRPSRINRAEPRPTGGLPSKPTDLAPEAAVAWDRVTAELGPSGVHPQDITVERGQDADAVARYETAAVMLAGSGPLIRGARHGELVKNPLHQIVRDNAMLLLAFARELGATPSARSGLRAPAAEPGARLAAFLAEGRRG